MTEFNYQENGESKGPFSVEELKTKNITKQTLVWATGMDNWVPAETVEELAVLFAGQETNNDQTPPQPQAQPQAEAKPQAGAMPPKNYLVESIIVTCVCCMPLGIVGIINAVKVNDLFYAGNVAQAEAAAAEAKKWSKLGGILGLVAVVGYAIFMLIGFAATM